MLDLINKKIVKSGRKKKQNDIAAKNEKKKTERGRKGGRFFTYEDFTVYFQHQSFFNLFYNRISSVFTFSLKK